MRAPFSFIKSSVAAFDPATLSLTSWWRASYGGSPWAPTASAGSSGSRGNLVTNTGMPSVGTAQNGLTPAQFNGTTQDLTNATTSSTLFTAGAGTIVALWRGDTAATASGNDYDDPAIYLDAGVAQTGLTFTASGFTGFLYDGVYRANTVAAGTGAYHLVMMRWNGVILGMTLDSAAENTTLAGPVILGAGSMSVGRGYGGGFINGRLLELMTADSSGAT
jgi:hypothetical protein